MSARALCPLLLVTVLVPLLGAPASAATLQDRGAPPRHARGPGSRLHKLLDRIDGRHEARQQRRGDREELREQLGLTRGQREQMKALRAQHKETLETRRAGLHDARHALEKLVRDGSTDAAALQSVSQRVAEALQALATERAALRRELQSSLTPAQQALLEQHRAQREAEQEQRRAEPAR